MSDEYTDDTDDVIFDEGDDEPQQRRAPAVPETLPVDWVQQLAFEVALEYFTPEDLELKFGLDAEDMQRIGQMPKFRKAVNDYRRQIDDEGIAIKLRAKAMAGHILNEMYAAAFDQTIDPKVRRGVWNDLMAYAGHGVKDGKGDDSSGIKLHISTNLNLGTGNDTGQTYVIEAKGKDDG